MDCILHPDGIMTDNSEFIPKTTFCQGKLTPSVPHQQRSGLGSVLDAVCFRLGCILVGHISKMEKEKSSNERIGNKSYK
jgi:hypothetical protein